MMTEAITKARADIAKAVESRIVERMAMAVEKAKAEIAESVLADCDDPFDIEALESSIGEELAGFDWTAATG